ncbi:MAG: hypothetical protein HYY20_11835 [Candidatus Tectomicrobia bacterium]|uniref:Uncharacterized protein n=1 Tax=Tectimicrobiota bacterium TaxID=2528274 RepID=A0A932FW90_UNCTE|nr:hypothetical protein [Candidatus Tectomicrobia bacterium]
MLEKFGDLARRRQLLLLANSDAHTLNDLGRYFNEISLEELCQRVRQGVR